MHACRVSTNSSNNVIVSIIHVDLVNFYVCSLFHFVRHPPSLFDLDISAVVMLVEQQVVLLQICVCESVLHCSDWALEILHTIIIISL